MDNNLKCLILSYTTNYNVLTKLVNTSLARKCVTTCLTYTNINIDIITKFTNLNYIAHVNINNLNQITKIAKLPKLQYCHFLIENVGVGAATIAFCQVYLINNNLLNKDFHFTNLNNQITLVDGIVSSNFIITDLIMVLVRYHNLFGIELNNYLQVDLNFLLSIPELTKIKIINEFGNYHLYRLAIDLLNSNKIKLITEELFTPPHAGDTMPILLNTNNGIDLEIIDVDVNYYSVDLIVNKFKKVKQIKSIFCIINQFYINLIKNTITEYPHLTWLIVVYLYRDVNETKIDWINRITIATELLQTELIQFKQIKIY